MNLTPQKNAIAVSLKDVPQLAIDTFRTKAIELANNGGLVLSFFGTPKDDQVAIYCAIGTPANSEIFVFYTVVSSTYEALTPHAPQFHWFERELAEQWAIIPTGHPWLKPIRFLQTAYNGKNILSPDAPIQPGVTDYFRMSGLEPHEVAVGPVHAGIIEPGHFRFQCHGEDVFHLEIELGYQHRGIEKKLVGGPDTRTPFYIETLAGDSTIAHTIAYTQAIEALYNIDVPERATYISAIALELERLANHTGDLGALAGDIGYLPTLSFNGRIRGDYLNMTGLLCGNRFGRNLIRPGGVRFDVSKSKVDELKKRLATIYRDTQISCDLLWATPSVMARFENTGVIAQKDGIALGWVGPTARSVGIDTDARTHFPFGVYKTLQIPVATQTGGDVYSRAKIRWNEIEFSKSFIEQALDNLPEGPIDILMSEPIKHAPAPEQLVVSLTEGWRGLVCHTIVTDKSGKFDVYKVIDPSFHNWFALSMALRNEQISDFPLCNKSFNLSYCGHDL
ncbi:MAG: hydrogenase [Deltaproteobacteria bacterium]|nr:hydrogenase [Deltaproteobacteria bacterium]MBN2673548.1 hydrogenase [Deltaproteobacteria bacterium]